MGGIGSWVPPTYLSHLLWGFEAWSSTSMLNLDTKRNIIIIITIAMGVLTLIANLIFYKQPQQLSVISFKMWMKNIFPVNDIVVG